MEPRYHAVRAAAAYAGLARAAVVLGSATPEVAWLYHARQDNWPVLELPLRILAHQPSPTSSSPTVSRSGEQVASDPGSLPLPPVKVVDMRQELKAGNRSIFSRALLDGLAADPGSLPAGDPVPQPARLAPATSFAASAATACFARAATCH